jgi:hypothetical protein
MCTKPCALENAKILINFLGTGNTYLKEWLRAAQAYKAGAILSDRFCAPEILIEVVAS